ncbi:MULTISPECIES: hypothetical protein [Streptomyces]|uniref:Porphobilinogen deaminase N-terminal domain-containing protein n=1 Tax=Streptomyces ramulosus TaxID=47762 RepID=A0ABW1FSP7_9ACTN
MLLAGAPPINLASLPSGAVVGISAPRRAAQLQALRAELSITQAHGDLAARLAHLGYHGVAPPAWTPPGSRTRDCRASGRPIVPQKYSHRRLPPCRGRRIRDR